MWPSAAAPAGSAASTPASAVISAATSATVRPIGPAVSCEIEIGMMPLRLTSPTVGLRPTSPFTAAGQMMLPSVSVPTPTAARLAAIADAGAGARSAGIAIEHVGVLRLPAARAPAGRRPRRAEVGPLAQVGLAEDDRAGLAQPRDDEGILPAACASPSPATRRSSPGRRRRCCPSAAPGCRAADRAPCRPCARRRARRRPPAPPG